MPRYRRVPRKHLTVRQVGAGLATVAAVCGLLGLTVFDVTLIETGSSGSAEATQAGAAIAPPHVPVEIKARTGRAVFSDDVAVPRESAFQVVVLARNIGQVDASGATIRVALPEGVRLQPGSCQVRSGGRPVLRRCPDNLVNGGFAYDNVGQGGWAQIYFEAEISAPRAAPDRVWTIHAIVNSNETPELSDAVRIYSRASD